jgi:hypothetical protein
MKPARVRGKFNSEMLNKCQQFANESLDTSIDEYTRRGQDPNKRYRMLIQITNGKLAEEMAFATYQPYFPDLTLPDYQIYGKRRKSWAPDLTSVAGGFTLSVKAKDSRDAERWGASWIFEKKDKETFGPKLDGLNLDPHQYVCLVVIDPISGKGEVLACVKLQWLHDHHLFEQPDRDYLVTMITVRFSSMLKVIQSADDLWQLKLI